jgi:oxygen-independent coproporphyrinogen-3 oxidase
MGVTTSRLSRDALIEKYDGQAPRYTRYPTVTQFTPEVMPEIYSAWLKGLPDDEPVSLFIHVPFCSRLCWNCARNTRPASGRGMVAAYVLYLEKELLAVHRALGRRRLRVSSIHFGGGTPNILKPIELRAVMATLSAAFRFAGSLEVGAELDPEILTKEWVTIASVNGLSRASLGVQNLDRNVQAAVHRPEAFDHIADCMRWLRDGGVTSINMDLMYGLPHQTRANTLATLDSVMTLRPERVSLLGYTLPPGMTDSRKLIEEAALPGASERLDQSDAAAERLTSEGYVHIGLDQFALPEDDLCQAQAEGRLHRNFQGYTADSNQVVIGMGPSAIGSLPQGFVQNALQERDWRKALDHDQLPVALGAMLNADDRLRGEIIERLLCDFAVDLGEIASRYGRKPRDLVHELSRLESFAADGLVETEGSRLTVTEVGRLVVRDICAVFDVSFREAEARQSRAK